MNEQTLFIQKQTTNILTKKEVVAKVPKLWHASHVIIYGCESWNANT